MGRGEPRRRAVAGVATPGDLAALLARPRDSAVLLDFDGTLAPIVDQPDDARPLPEVLEALAALRRDFGCVAVLSGRPLGFLSSVLPEGLDLVGLDGLQRRVQGVVVEDPRVRAFAPIIQGIEREVKRLLPGVLIEPKSNITLSLHWRTNPSLERRIAEVARLLAERHGLVVQEGRMVVELRPAIPIDKGVVSRELVRGFENALFVGDDASDLVAFEALTDLRRSGALASLSLIAVMNDEIPAALTKMASGIVAGTRGVGELLCRLAEAP